MHSHTPYFFAAEPSCTKAVKDRADIPEKDKWRLTDLYPDDEAFALTLESTRQKLPALQAYKGTLSDADTLFACLQLRDAIDLASSRLFAYARMHRDTDHTDSHYQAMTTRALSFISEVQNAQSFIEPELLAFPEGLLDQLLENDPRFGEYAFFLKDLLRQKQHILSAAEEALLATAGEISQSPADIFTMLTNADLRFPETQTDDGSTVILTESRYNQLIRSQNPVVRKEAFHHLFTTYAAFRNTFAASYTAQIQSSIFHARARHYQSTLDLALDRGNIPAAVYENTIAAAHANLDSLHEYVLLKKEVLGLDEIHMYDLYTQMVDITSPTYSYEEAFALIEKALAPLGEEYLAQLKAARQDGWIDIYENKGKRNGAYSWGVYGAHPFVFLNYDGQYNAVSTLAHELGHAMHSFYSNQSQPAHRASYTIFCAEVASTTNENLLLDYMLDTVTKKEDRLYFLQQYLEQVRTTVYRQILFAEFEQKMHQKVEQDRSLTADDLEAAWMSLNRQYYGSDIVLDDPLRIEWARIPHFYRPFYVYQYATGYAAATAISERLQKDPLPARRDYLSYLQSGGSDYSLPLLQKAGVDMRSTEPLQVTLTKFKHRLQEFKTLFFSIKE